MIGLLLRAIFVLVLAFALALGVIIVQPEDAALRAFFAPPDCAAPCFLGIRPGVTTVDQALALLQASSWVRGINTAESESPAHAQTNTNIYWGWTGQQPDFVFDLAAFTLPYMHIRNGIVQYIRLVTRIPYGDAWLSLGVPSTGTLTVRNPNSANFVYLHSAGYFGGKLVFDTEVTCPVTPAAFWNASVSISYSDGSLTAYSMPDYHFDRTLYRMTCPA
ncbi:MAG: hypothetical protein ABI700_13250 [Chloroflexota bacterium]